MARHADYTIILHSNDSIYRGLGSVPTPRTAAIPLKKVMNKSITTSIIHVVNIMKSLKLESFVILMVLGSAIVSKLAPNSTK